MEHNLLTYKYDILGKAKLVLGEKLYNMVDPEIIKTTFWTFKTIEEFEDWLYRQEIIGNFRLGVNRALRLAVIAQENWTKVCMEKCICCNERPVSYAAYYYHGKKYCNGCLDP